MKVEISEIITPLPTGTYMNYGKETTIKQKVSNVDFKLVKGKNFLSTRQY